MRFFYWLHIIVTIQLITHSAEPTVGPSKSPTPPPTTIPTEAPSQSPTGGPTEAPMLHQHCMHCTRLLAPPLLVPRPRRIEPKLSHLNFSRRRPSLSLRSALHFLAAMLPNYPTSTACSSPSLCPTI